MDTEITLDLNKPLFSYSRYEINDHGYGDDFIHRDGDGVNMQVFFDRATGEFVSKGVSISDFTNLVEGKSARDTNAWTRHSLDPKELLPDDISKVEINDGMMAFLKTYTLSDKRYMTSISRMPISTVRFTVKSETGRLLFYGELSIDLPRPARMCSNSKASIRYRPATMKNCSMADANRFCNSRAVTFPLMSRASSDGSIRSSRVSSK